MAKKSHGTEMLPVDGSGATEQQTGDNGKPKAPKRTPAEKADAFTKLGTKRVRKVIKTMKGIANLANRSNYVYTTEQADKILAAIVAAVKEVQFAFSGQKNEDSGFTL